MKQRRLSRADAAFAVGEGVTLIPFGFQVNGTSNPDNLKGDSLQTATRNEAGEWLLTFRDLPADVFYADAQISSTADDVDIYAKCDWSTTATDGKLVIRAMTGAVETDPTDNLLVGGFILAKKTTRKAKRSNG